LPEPPFGAAFGQPWMHVLIDQVADEGSLQRCDDDDRFIARLPGPKS
jgi:hypothetical protein